MSRPSLMRACQWIVQDLRALDADLEHVCGTEETMRALSLHRVNLRQSLMGLERALSPTPRLTDGQRARAYRAGARVAGYVQSSAQGRSAG